MSIITFIPSLKIKADVKQINPYSIPENPSLNLHFVWLVGLEDLKWDVKSLKLPSLGLSSYDDKWLKTLSIQTNHVHSIFLFIKRYLKTVPKGAKSFSDTHSDFDFSVTVIAIVEMFSPNKVWRL